MSLLDKLPNIPFLKSHQAQTEYYFALNIGTKKVEGAVWGVSGNKLEVVNNASAEYSEDSELIQAANKALDEALADFYFEPTKLLFGVPEHWLRDENLKPEYAAKLKHISKELGLTPMAFVSTTHAVSHFLQKLQGVPITSILVETGDPLEVSIVKAGKVLVHKTQPREENLPNDIQKALISVSEQVEVLPAKIVLFGEGRLEKLRDELTGFSWTEELPFLHIPRVEDLELDAVITAVCFAGASELKEGVVYDPKFISPKEHHTKPLESNHRKSNLEDLGFVEGNISKSTAQPGSILEEDEVNVSNPDRNKSTKSLLPFSLSALPKVYNPFQKTASGVIAERKKLNFLNSKLLIALGAVLLLLAAYIFIPKAEVTVFLDLKILEKESQVTADPTISSVDEEKKLIPGKVVETEVVGTKKAQATGKKQVGDPAKGAVVIYNKTSAPKVFAAGTVLNGPDNLKFTLDSQVNVASQSAVEGGISFGKTTGNVTASSIGPEGNLAAGKDLTFKDFPTSSYSAKVDTAFSGGVSKDVTVVSSDDQKKLLASLISELNKEAKDKLQEKLEENMKVLEEGLSEQIIKQTFSKGIGDQASEFTLNATIRFRGTAYNENDLRLIVSKLVETNVPDGYTLDLSQTETQADVAKIEKNGKLIFAAKFRAKLMPKIDAEKLKKEIVGKTPNEAANSLKKIENVIGSNFKITPKLPGPLERLPFFANNIKLEITAK